MCLRHARIVDTAERMARTAGTGVYSSSSRWKEDSWTTREILEWYTPTEKSRQGRRPMQVGRHGSLTSQWLHDSPQYYSVREAILSAENSGIPLGGGRGLAPNSGAQRSSRPHSWWGGSCCPIPKNPTPALGLRPFVPPPNEKSWALP